MLTGFRKGRFPTLTPFSPALLASRVGDRAGERVLLLASLVETSNFAEASMDRGRLVAGPKYCGQGKRRRLASAHDQTRPNLHLAESLLDTQHCRTSTL
jgi:hypothetical protein